MVQILKKGGQYIINIKLYPKIVIQKTCYLSWNLHITNTGLVCFKWHVEKLF